MDQTPQLIITDSAKEARVESFGTYPITRIALNRSKHLEGKSGFYNGKKITSKYIELRDGQNV